MRTRGSGSPKQMKIKMKHETCPSQNPLLSFVRCVAAAEDPAPHPRRPLPRRSVQWGLGAVLARNPESPLPTNGNVPQPLATPFARVQERPWAWRPRKQPKTSGTMVLGTKSKRITSKAPRAGPRPPESGANNRNVCGFPFRH